MVPCNRTSELLAALRAAEQLAAAQVLGIPATNVTLLDFEDGLLNNAPERAVRERVVATLRTVRPEAVFVWSPYLDFSRYYYGFEHPDHRTTGQIVLDAAYPSARDWLAFPDLATAGVMPFPVKDVFLYAFSATGSAIGAGSAITTYVDVSADEVMSAKIAALSAHRSQYSNATAVADGVRTFAALVASEVNDSGGPVLTYAEAFAHVPMLPGS